MGRKPKEKREGQKTMNKSTAKKLMANIKEKYIIGRQAVEYRDFLSVMIIIEDLLDKVETKEEQNKVVETL